MSIPGLESWIGLGWKTLSHKLAIPWFESCLSGADLDMGKVLLLQLKVHCFCLPSAEGKGHRSSLCGERPPGPGWRRIHGEDNSEKAPENPNIGFLLGVHQAVVAFSKEVDECGVHSKVNIPLIFQEIAQD